MADQTSATSSDTSQLGDRHGLEIGQCVIHPQHGPATLIELETRILRGEEMTFAVLERDGEDLVLKVPIDALEDIGVRDTVGEERAEEVLEILAQEPVELSRSWQKRRSRNERRIRSGRLSGAAEVVRDLLAYEAKYDLPSTDRHMYEEARSRLVNELAVALDEQPDEVEQLVDRTLNGRT